MSQTSNSFSEKWHNNKDLAFIQTLNPDSEIHQWIVNRNGFKSAIDLGEYLNKFNKILDAGCGNGRVTALLRSITDEHKVSITGIDLTAWDVAQENLAEEKNVTFYKADLTKDLAQFGNFDFIYCQEVLHHTDNPYGSFKNLVSILNPEGEIAIYVYRKKAPIREFSDDFIRDRIINLSYDEAMQHCREITALGKTLSDLKIEVDVPEVSLLGIEKGQYDIQRLIYNYFLKCFWNDEFKFEDNAVINFDWFHPEQCMRYSIEEIEEWFTSQNLRIIHRNIDPYGITMRGVKNK